MYVSIIVPMFIFRSSSYFLVSSFNLFFLGINSAGAELACEPIPYVNAIFVVGSIGLWMEVRIEALH